MVELLPHQEEAIKKMKNGCILCGGVGSGKSITSIAYYFIKSGGSIKPFRYPTRMRDLYIITTARKRDTFEWDDEMLRFGLVRGDEAPNFGNKVYIDSWNNIKKYAMVKDALFIFDEQRVIGTGAWVKAFLKIAKNNEWILLSATPGDTWLDYIPVFIANGFYRNFTEFRLKHVVYNSFTKYRQVERYLDVRRLERLRSSILVDMPFDRPTVPHHIDIYTEYDKTRYLDIIRNRFNYEKNEPFKGAADLCSALRKVCNTSPDRIVALLDVFKEKHKVIVFYNFDYELDLMKDIFNQAGITYAEWNGHKHQPIPETKEWFYLVHYNAGAEGWNCVKTDTIVFYSQNYSYKMMAQAAGRIDRMNTKFVDLWYYHFKTRSSIDKGIDRAISAKKKFNETKFYSALC